MKIEPQVVEADNLLMRVKGLQARVKEINVELEQVAVELENLHKQDTFTHEFDVERAEGLEQILKSELAYKRKQLSEIDSKQVINARKKKDAAIKKQSEAADAEKTSPIPNPELKQEYHAQHFEVRPLSAEEAEEGYRNMGINPQTGRSTDFEKKQQYAGMEAIQKMQVRSGKPKAKSQDEQYEYDEYGVRIPKNKKQPTQQNTGYQRTR